MSERPWLCVFASDFHAGSRTGLCPASGIVLEGNDLFIPGPDGQKTWECWKELWQTVDDRRRELGAKLAYFFNGDLTDGRVFRDQALIDISLGVQVDIAIQCLAPAMALKPERVFVSRGTPVHVGPSGDLEAAVAKAIGAEHHPTTKKRTAYKWDIVINGFRLLAIHHPPSSGRLVRTRKSQLALAANEVFNRYAERGLEPPRLVVFSHAHDPDDSGPVLPHREGTRAVILGPWQRKTQYAERVAGLAFGEHHAMLLTVWPGSSGRVEQIEHLVWPKRGQQELPEVVL